MIKAAVFDLDGTLANTLDSITYYVNAATATHGLSPLDNELVKKFVGNGAKLLIERSLTHLGAIEHFDSVYALYNRLYEQQPYHLLQEYPGISDMLDALRVSGCSIAVLSNKPHKAALPVCQYLFADKIDYVLGNKPGIPHKPDITGVQLVLDRLNVTAKECLYVGDTDCDMQTGKNAGMLTVGVSWGFRPRQELWDTGADYVIDRPDQLITLFRQKNTLQTL